VVRDSASHGHDQRQGRSFHQRPRPLAAKELQAPYQLVREVAERGELPVVLFVAGGIATPADAAMVGISVAELPAPHRLADRGW
jgi:pyridoxal biosynthesis lyase PdxS